MSKYCFITGAAGGLGRVFAFEAAKQGYDLVLTDLNKSGLVALAKGIKAIYDRKPIIIQADITNQSESKKIWEYLKQNQLTLSLVINIAGIEVEGLFESQELNDLLKIVNINVIGTLSVLSECIKYQDKHLDIINISSMAGFYSMPYKAVYSATKSFIISISRSLDVELKDRSVNVMALCPAGMPTRQIVVDRIASQGIVGDLTTINASVVARRAIKRVKKGKQIYVPGFINKVFILIGNLMPKKLQTCLISSRWKKTSSRLKTKN